MLILIFFASLLGSILTFFSGFGLGTILLPVFLLIFPIEIAIPATALVHFANSIFKFTLLYKYINYSVFLKFGIPAILAALLGSNLLLYFSQLKQTFVYSLFGIKNIKLSALNFTIGLLIISFTIFESNKSLKSLIINSKYLFVGGLISGFFGGISGHQGALRSLFLKNLNLTKTELVATSTSISLGIDVARLFVYIVFMNFAASFNSSIFWFLIIGIYGSLIGVSLGNQLLKKITIEYLQKIISICLIIFGILMMIGLI